METITRRRGVTWGRNLGLAALLVSLVLSSGCSLLNYGVEPKPWKPHPEGSTIGTDPNTVPKGHSIPPPSLGVDMTSVDVVPGAGRLIPPLVTVSLPDGFEDGIVTNPQYEIKEEASAHGINLVDEGGLWVAGAEPRSGACPGAFRGMRRLAALPQPPLDAPPTTRLTT